MLRLSSCKAHRPGDAIHLRVGKCECGSLARAPPAMRIIGLTGGISTGKSTVSNYLKSQVCSALQLR